MVTSLAAKNVRLVSHQEKTTLQSGQFAWSESGGMKKKRLWPFQSIVGTDCLQLSTILV
jgi:hypothetical protein